MDLADFGANYQYVRVV